MNPSENLREDLKAFSALGNGLWTDPRVSKRSTLETLSASLFFSDDPEERMEKAASALLERAKILEGQVHQAAALDFISAPFYRLGLEERFILICLHIGHWSYARLARILKVTLEEVEERAWSARLKMAAGQSVLTYPAGPTQPEESCPAYHSKRPWMQKLLDNEISSRLEKLRLEQHLPACSSCALALRRSREFYYELDRKIIETVGKSDFVEVLEKVFQQGESLIRSPRSLAVRSLIALIKSREVQILLFLWACIILIRSILR